MDRAEAERLLRSFRDSGPGCYIFRESLKGGKGIVLSVISIDGTVKHLKVHVGPHPNGGSSSGNGARPVGFALDPGGVADFNLDAAEAVFSTLSDLKSHYSVSKGMLKYRLCQEVEPTSTLST